MHLLHQPEPQRHIHEHTRAHTHKHKSLWMTGLFRVHSGMKTATVKPYRKAPAPPSDRNELTSLKLPPCEHKLFHFKEIWKQTADSTFSSSLPLVPASPSTAHPKLPRFKETSRSIAQPGRNRTALWHHIPDQPSPPHPEHFCLLQSTSWKPCFVNGELWGKTITDH